MSASVESLSAALGNHEPLTFDQARALARVLLSGELTDTEAASLLVQLAEKGETSEELHGFVTSLLEHAEPVPFDGATIDTCGTGGSGLERFNVSTLVAFVLAAAGLTVAKHGNRGSRRPNGSFDLLEALGVPIDLDGQAVARALEETGLAFLYARRFHPVMKGVAQARKLAARRTIFNLAGPLSNPTRVQVQVVGSCSERDARTVAGCLWRMGRHQAITVTGHSGIDEVDLAGPSLFFRASAEPVADSFDPELLGLSRIPYAELPGGDAGVNAELFRSLLAGTGSKPLAQLVCFSAAVVFRACGKAKELAEGLEQARELLGSGQVREKFEQYKALAQRLHKP